MIHHAQVVVIAAEAAIQGHASAPVRALRPPLHMVERGPEGEVCPPAAPLAKTYPCKGERPGGEAPGDSSDSPPSVPLPVVVAAPESGFHGCRQPLLGVGEALAAVPDLVAVGRERLT